MVFGAALPCEWRCARIKSTAPMVSRADDG